MKIFRVAFDLRMNDKHSIESARQYLRSTIGTETANAAEIAETSPAEPPAEDTPSSMRTRFTASVDIDLANPEACKRLAEAMKALLGYDAARSIMDKLGEQLREDPSRRNFEFRESK